MRTIYILESVTWIQWSSCNKDFQIVEAVALDWIIMQLPWWPLNFIIIVIVIVIVIVIDIVIVIIIVIIIIIIHHPTIKFLLPTDQTTPINPIPHPAVPTDTMYRDTRSKLTGIQTTTEWITNITGAKECEI